jgi:outer membrane protein OmpA-like peptidoglycan-associated protein
MSNTPGLPERQSRSRAGLVDPAAAPPAGSRRLPTIGRDNAVDLDRLRASATAAIEAEADVDAADAIDEIEAPTPSGPPGADRREGPGRRSGDGTGVPGWMRIAVPAGIIVALAALGVALLGGDDDTTVATDDSSATTAAPAPTTILRPTSAVETTAPVTEAPAATEAPTTVPAAPPVTADPAAPPPHKATYRGGKLYLEGRITSQEEAQKYIDKAAAVLGADNVVNNYEIDASVPLSNDGTVYVDEPFLFETGSAQLNPQYTGVLGLGVAALKLNPAARMIVTGYTDSTGKPEKNQELSVARATAVVDYMVTTGGIDRSRFDAIGAGDQNPVGDNATEEGRQLNRRIDVKLVNLLG